MFCCCTDMLNLLFFDNFFFYKGKLSFFQKTKTSLFFFIYLKKIVLYYFKLYTITYYKLHVNYKWQVFIFFSWVRMGWFLNKNFFFDFFLIVESIFIYFRKILFSRGSIYFRNRSVITITRGPMARKKWSKLQFNYRSLNAYLSLVVNIFYNRRVCSLTYFRQIYYKWQTSCLYLVSRVNFFFFLLSFLQKQVHSCESVLSQLVSVSYGVTIFEYIFFTVLPLHQKFLQ